MLTPLIDVFSILVIFLLLQFNVESTPQIQDQIRVPIGEKGSQFIQRAQIEIDKTMQVRLINGSKTLQFENFDIGQVDSWLADNELDIKNRGLNIFSDERIEMRHLRPLIEALSKIDMANTFFAVQNFD